jgi:hypothetical protein
MLKQMRSLREEVQVAGAAKLQACAEAEAAQRLAKEAASRAAMARERARLREERVNVSAETVERLNAMVRVLHAQLLQALQVRPLTL